MKSRAEERHPPGWVLQTIASLDPVHGGPSRTVPALVDALKARGIAVELVVADHLGASVVRRPEAEGAIKAAARQAP